MKRSIPLRTAVIPAAGFGTRFLPASKAVPKEMIPLVDKPVIQYVVEEAVAAGLTRIAIIVSEGKEAVAAHFQSFPAMEDRLEKTGKKELLSEIRSLSSIPDITFIPQKELKGLGDAVLQAKDFVNGEPFAVLLGDTVLRAEGRKSVTGQLKEVYEKTLSSVVASEHVPRERISKYGIIESRKADGFSGKVEEVLSLVEKPSPEDAPGDLAIASRYLFTPGIFEELENTPPGKGGEIQLTDAMKSLLKKERMFTRIIDGKRYDLGSKIGFLKSTVEFALARDEFREEMLCFLREKLADYEMDPDKQ
ncbi:MAG: UTP--glucose-1-phosphate uridylyltransferase [Lentisphaeria bacterium]|nr:UTP--glucose-1-phosphate uridylyltransferase [Lentisphaeria bacterium]